MRKLREVFRSRSVTAGFCDRCSTVWTSAQCLDQHIEQTKVKVLLQSKRGF